MGLAVLPGRLKEELEILGRYMIADDYAEKIKNDAKVEKHLDWAEKIHNKYSDINAENVDKILKDEVGVTFSRVLEYAGVYKRDAAGNELSLIHISEPTRRDGASRMPSSA